MPARLPPGWMTKRRSSWELVLTFCLAKNTFLADINEQGPFESMFMTENRAEIEFLSMASFLKSVFTRVS